MSELKATSSGEIRAIDSLLGYWWYKKFEADKVIAELQSKITFASLADDCSNLRNKRCNYCSALQRQKYKRCRTLADRCHDNVLYLQAKRDTDPVNECKTWYARRARWWEKWERIWIALANKFKEGK